MMEYLSRLYSQSNKVGGHGVLALHTMAEAGFHEYPAAAVSKAPAQQYPLKQGEKVQRRNTRRSIIFLWAILA